MAVIEDLSEEEAYLWALLSDPSGLDQAEFAFKDHENPDGCWRAWAFQWKWFRCTDPLQISQCGRSVGKSLSIKIRAFAFPFIHPGQELVITAPELIHLHPITGLIEGVFSDIRLASEMLPKGKNRGTTHRPFQMDFLNGSRIMGRIPQRDGKGAKGLHPIWLEADESQDYPDAGWIELIETLKRGVPGAVWRAHGVTRGVRDFFYKFSQPGSGWTVHNWTAMHRPTWTDEEREEKINQYGSREHPDYRRNILGAHGDSQNPLFVLARLMACVDSEQDSNYNQNEYNHIRLNFEMVQDYDAPITQMLDFPQSHKKYPIIWIGMDVGYMQHPSEILVFAETTEKAGAASTMKLLTRIHLERISHGDQVATILWLIDWYRPKAFALDKTGLGLPLFQDLQARAPHHLGVIKGYNFSENILVDFDQSVEVDEYRGDVVKDSGIKRKVLEYAQDKLREFVDDKRLLLPWDRDLIGEFQGQTYKVVRDPVSQYGKREFSKGKFHALDAARMAVLAKVQTPIEEFTKSLKDPGAPVLDVFIADW